VEGRVVSPPAVPRLISPGTGAAAEHVAAHHHSSNVLGHLLDDRSGFVDLAVLLPVLVAPGRQLESPLVQPHAALAERVLLTLIRSGDEAIQ
jgi:hypothetical protein